MSPPETTFSSPSRVVSKSPQVRLAQVRHFFLSRIFRRPVIDIDFEQSVYTAPFQYPGTLIVLKTVARRRTFLPIARINQRRPANHHL